jgi:RNA polymerase subunit RPABC4/transcription elongation factor Spt4
VGALFDQIGQSIGGFFGQPVVRTVGLLAVSYLVIVWLATALWAFSDMRRRTPNPIVPYASAAMVVLASPMLFPLALLVHVIVRPSQTVAERRLAALRDLALGAEMDRPICPGCRRLVDEGWLVCPSCRTSLAHRCDACGHAAGIDAEACPWCGSLFGPPAGMVVEQR